MGCGSSVPVVVHHGVTPQNNNAPSIQIPSQQGEEESVSKPQQQQQQQQQPIDDGKIFEDADFPATVDTITKDTNNENYEKFKDALWRRPDEIMSCNYDEIKVFDSIDIDDIEQGLLGNCYFLASLSGLAEVPERVRAIFQTSTVNKNGKYGVRFYVRGIPTIITIDDRFPCSNEEPYEPLFSKPKGKELWSILLEKAWAKLFKGYINIEAGTMEEALEHLTGAPSFGFMIEQEPDDETWNKLKHADSMGYTIGAGSRGDVQESTGIVEGHAYTIVSVHEVQGHKLVRLRNPWGSGEWKGDFSDSSPLWNESLKKAVQYEDADNGMFYMTLQDFRAYYADYSVHRYYKNWHYSYVEQRSGPKHANYYKFTVDKPCEAYFRIHQEDKRSLPEEERESFKYSPASFMIVKVEKNGHYKLVLDSDVKTDSNLIFGDRSLYMTKDGKVHIKEAGDYIIRAKVYWRHGHEDTCTISAYSSVKINLKPIPSVKDFLTKYLTLVAEQKEAQPLGDSSCVRVMGTYETYSYGMVKNQGDKDFTCSLIFSKLENMKLSKPHRVSDTQFTMTIAPGSSQLVFTKDIELSENSNYSSSWSWQS